MRGSDFSAHIPSLGMPPPRSRREKEASLGALTEHFAHSDDLYPCSGLVYAPLLFVFVKIPPLSPLVAVKVKRRVSVSLSSVFLGL